MTKLFLLIFSIFGIYAQVNGINKYTKYTLMRITPHNEQQLKLLNKFVNTGTEEVDVLKYSHGLNDTTDVLVSPKRWKELRKIATKRGLTVKSKHNYGRYYIDKEAKITKLSSHQNAFDKFKYNSYDAIQKELRRLKKKYLHLVKLETAGTSYEGRVMRVIKISSNHAAKNPIIFLDAGTHAREWASVALAMYLINQLVVTTDDLGGVDWYILPVVNPDGYEYTRGDPENRMWRKSRSKTWREECLGVDINRNYNFKWGYSGASFDPCDYQIYAGDRAFSEREARLVRRIMKRYSSRIKLYMAIHTYGQYLVYPWGYTGDHLPSGWKKLHKLGERFSKAVEEAGGPAFKTMSGGQWYPASGASDDFAFAVIKIPYSYTLEITDGYEFLLPEKLLSTCLPQYYEGFKVLAKQIKSEFGRLKNQPER